MDYVKNDVLCTAFSYARYGEAMEEITVFAMKDCLSLPRLGWKYFKSLRTEVDEPVYTNNDIYMRYFVRLSIKRRSVCDFNQYYESKFCDDILSHISKELNVKGKIYGFLEAYLNYQNEHLEIIKKNIKEN